mmetsp:Transcript_109876/g.342475  ORF Transcript_109876/g.342475 Transcript_109876/m.342475 type:complete len:436 (-) Transcript_109876:175-1482(-)
MCGQSKKIGVYASDMQKVDALDGHSSFVSSLVLVDRSETRTLWSSSLGDHSLRVWRHVLRGGSQSVAELTAANMMYEEQQWASDERIRKAEDSAGSMQAELEAAAAEFAQELLAALARAARADQAREAAEAERARAFEREGWARRAEAEAKEAQTALKAELEAAVRARQVATEEAQARAAEALAAEEVRRRFEAERDASRQEAAMLGVQLAEQRSHAEGLEHRLESALAGVAKATARAEALMAQLGEQAQDLRSVQAAFDKELQKCKELEEQAEGLRAQISSLEFERDGANDREKQLMLRYAELDVFKLDVIARELKNVDRQMDCLRGDARTFQEAVKKFINSNDQTASTKVALRFVDATTKLRGTFRDIIERCLSETQKLHVGAAVKDPTAAGLLKDGGKMAGYVRPGDANEGGGSSHPRQQDEIRREKRKVIS